MMIANKWRFMIFVLMLLLFSYNVSAFNLAQIEDIVNRIKVVLDEDSPSATAFEIGDFASSLFCGCVSTNSCTGISVGLCLDLTNPDFEFNNDGLRWASSWLSNPEQNFCSVLYQGAAYDMGVTFDNNEMNTAFQRTPNAYLEAARVLDNEINIYTYYFSFNFFPSENYTSSRINFFAKSGNNIIDLDTEVFPVTKQGFRHRIIRRSNELYDYACMRFNNGNPSGFSRNELCVRVTQV